jgi:hypothetical protein
VTFLDEPSDAPSSRHRLVIGGAVLLLVVLVLVVLAWTIGSRPAPVRTAAAPTAAPPVATEAPLERAAETPAAAAPARRAGLPAKAAAPPPATVEPALPSLTLKVTSDVAGADVFVDRVYLGKAPLESHDVKAGSHVLTVSAEGYESQELPVEVKDGANEVAVAFKVVRLDEAIAVVHKHAMGSCDGRLLADPHGLRYVTANKDHAFDIPFSDLRAFEVDYLQKNLRVVRQDGKTFNFTDRTANADALFVFHKKVEAARAKLKSQ